MSPEHDRLKQSNIFGKQVYISPLVAIDPSILQSLSSQANLDYVLDQHIEPVNAQNVNWFNGIDPEILITNESNEYEIEEYPIFTNEYDEKSMGMSLVMNTNSKFRSA